MKMLVYGDLHWSQYSSIVRERGLYFSTRLQNNIDSLDWVETLSYEKGCEKVICVGDFFDKADLNSEEITALSKIKWNNYAQHYFLVGNHEMGTNDLQFSSTEFFSSLGFNVIKFVDYEKIDDNLGLIFLPYLVKDRRSTIKDYVDKLTVDDPASNYVIFSHNDISGIQYGQFISKEGFDIKDISDNCKLFINGHLHNQTVISEKIINLGNLTGQNFSEDSYKYSHCAMILDTDTLTYELVVNPHALNFYKIEIHDESDLSKLHKLDNNAVVSIKCLLDLAPTVRRECEVILFNKISQFRIITFSENKKADTIDISSLAKLDHIESFKKYISNSIDNSDILESELSLL